MWSVPRQALMTPLTSPSQAREVVADRERVGLNVCETILGSATCPARIRWTELHGEQEFGKAKCRLPQILGDPRHYKYLNRMMMVMMMMMMSRAVLAFARELS